jgi:hypothetical protein
MTVTPTRGGRNGPDSSAPQCATSSQELDGRSSAIMHSVVIDIIHSAGTIMHRPWPMESAQFGEKSGRRSDTTSFPGSARERDGEQAPPAVIVCQIAICWDSRQSLDCSAFPDGAWERESRCPAALRCGGHSPPYGRRSAFFSRPSSSGPYQKTFSGWPGVRTSTCTYSSFNLGSR